jgi:hypothetical protein
MERQNMYFMQNRINTFSPYFAEYDRERCIAKLKEVFLATPCVDNAYNELKYL